MDESLQQQLDATRRPHADKRLLKIIKSVPRALQSDFQEAIAPKKKLPPGAFDHINLPKRGEHAALVFDQLKDRDRLQLWNLIFPHLANHVERAWQTIGERPYQRAGYRKPFRVPNATAIIRERRSAFFIALFDALHQYEADPAWLATWIARIGKQSLDPYAMSWLLATILRAGGKDAQTVRTILIDSINGDHAIGHSGVRAFAALLNSDDRGDWEFMGRLLLAAQRQEGLRQSILEHIDESHPDAFRYMLGLILEHDLARFSATVRAFDVWLGYQWAAGSVKPVNEGIARLCAFFDDGEACEEAIRGGTPEDAYLALWTIACRDAEAAIERAARLMDAAEPERRFVALQIMELIRLTPYFSSIPIAHLLRERETDERILSICLNRTAAAKMDEIKPADRERLFDIALRAFRRAPSKRQVLPPLVWPWVKISHEKDDYASVMRALCADDPAKLRPHVAEMGTMHCVSFIHSLAFEPRERSYSSTPLKRKALKAEDRRFIAPYLADARPDVSSMAFKALEHLPINEEETILITDKLHRTGGEFRKNALARLSTLPPADRLRVAETLLIDKHEKKRAAGLELAEALVSDRKWKQQATQLIERSASSLSEHEQQAVAARLGEHSAEQLSFDDCFGLVPPGSRCEPVKPVDKGVVTETKAAVNCIRSLAELFLQHSETEIERRSIDGTMTAGERVQIASYFPYPKFHTSASGEAKTIDLDALPLREIWVEWLNTRGPDLRDPDGLEFNRVWAIFNAEYEGPRRHLPQEFKQSSAWNLRSSFSNLVSWLPHLRPHPDAFAFLVQRAEDLVAKTKPLQGMGPKPKVRADSSGSSSIHEFSTVERFLRMNSPIVTDQTLLARFGALCMRHMDLRPERGGPSLSAFVAAFDAGLLNEFDFSWWLLRPRLRDITQYEQLLAEHHRISFGPIGEIIRLRMPSEVTEREPLHTMALRIRDRLLNIELTRGETPTIATKATHALRYAGGAETLFRLLAALGKDKLVRNNGWNDARSHSLSRLILLTVPGPSDTPERFAALYAESKIKPARMIELAMFAPQWAAHIERSIGLNALESAVWWIHAHTREGSSWGREELREQWAARINEHCELDAEDLEEGAVDVKWFQSLIHAIGEDGWTQILKPAKYASESAAHKRAELFARAMLNRVTAEDLLTRINDKRHQDSLRAYGLLPLPEDPTEARAETLRRYTRIQEFKRESKKFGSMRQASEGRAVDIAMQNLARTAGYRDPQRLEWAMEAEAVADLARGPVSVSVDETTVTLAIDDAGSPELTILKKGKPLKNIPAKLTKHPPIAELRARITHLRRQASRMRLSLETAMCRGDAFTGSELAEFFAHPVLRPMIERLVLINADTDATPLIGYPSEAGRLLTDHAGSIQPLGSKDTLRIAHPTDLYARGDWHEWQRHCLASERIQPFKQIFRELYTRTAAESNGAALTRRYAGHQVNPRQALALFKQRQWIFAPEEGVRRVFHDQGLIAELWFQEYFHTPADVEDLTLEGLAFRKRGSFAEQVPLTAIPERIFSEAMRDLDLVVSVAHSGGVDPEASASTVEMRAALLKETCQLLGLNNVRINGHHAMIDGTRASYSLHLGSANTMVLPGRSLYIVAVHSQYRGRLFLPFADNDPRTAEVMAKALLLARDKEIKDPSILSQIA